MRFIYKLFRAYNNSRVMSFIKSLGLKFGFHPYTSKDKWFAK